MIYSVYGFNFICDYFIDKYSRNITSRINGEFPIIKIVCCKKNSDIIDPRNVGNSEMDCQTYCLNDEYYFVFRNGRIVNVSKNLIKMHGGAFDEKMLGGADIVALSRMNGRAVLHGSAFLYKGKAYLICAESGAGKSTLSSAMSFYNNDIVILTDDIICISPDGSSMYAGLSQISLNSDSYSFFFRDNKGVSSNPKGFEKVTYRLSDLKENTSGKYIIGGVFFLRGRNKEGLVTISDFNRADFFLEGLKNIKMKHSINSKNLSHDIEIINNMVNNNFFGVSLSIKDDFSVLKRITKEIIAYIDGNNYEFKG